jgi:hypothetical protein
MLAAGCGPSRKELRPKAPVRQASAAAPEALPIRLAIAATVAREGISHRLEEAVPRQGEEEAPAFGGRKVHYAWRREPFEVTLAGTRMAAVANAAASATVLGMRDLPLRIRLSARPVLGADLQITAQAVEVEVTANGPVDRLNRAVEEQVKAAVNKAVEALRIDLRPLAGGVAAHLGQPLPLDVGEDATACLTLRASSPEAEPAIVTAQGIETELAISAVPSLALPCSTAASDRTITGAPRESSLPLGARSAVSRPAVDVPVRYQELARAMAKQGNLHFSQAHPGLYLGGPRVQPSGDRILVQVSIAGTAGAAGGATTEIAGDLFLAGHPQAGDGELAIPDLELTPESADELARVRPRVDAAELVGATRAALRVDIRRRIDAVRARFSRDLTFGDAAGCVRAEAPGPGVLRADVHPAVLRIAVQLESRTALTLPCLP